MNEIEQMQERIRTETDSDSRFYSMFADSVNNILSFHRETYILPSRNKREGYYYGYLSKHVRIKNKQLALKPYCKYKALDSFMKVLKGYSRGELTVICTGRREGKSMLFQHMQDSYKVTHDEIYNMDFNDIESRVMKQLKR